MKNFVTAILMTIVLTVLLGLIYPLAVTGIAQLIFPAQANGSLVKNAAGEIIGTELIGQPFTSAAYFHARPSAANYDGAASGGSNLGPTSAKLMERIKADAAKLQAENPSAPVPAELVTTSASGLDPHLSPAAAEFQLPRVAAARQQPVAEIRAVVQRFTEARQLGLLGEPRINVLLLNLALDRQFPQPQ
jgi:potassium-transporting ATPase KdpC subunit